MNQLRALVEQPGLQGGIVQIKPTLERRGPRGHCLGVDGDDLQVGVGRAVMVEFQQAVVGAKQRVFAASARRNAQRGFAPGHALTQGGGGNDEVVELG